MFSKDDFQRLLAVDRAPAVTIYLPTHRAGQDIRQDAVRLRNLIAKAQEALCDTQGMRRPDAERFLQAATALLDAGQDEFWRHQDRGLAILLADGVTAIHRLPVDVPEEVVVDSRFTLRPLLPLLADDGNFMILSITAARARLCAATRHGMAEEEADLPKGVAEVDAETDYDADTRHSAPPARRAIQAGRSGVTTVTTENFGTSPEDLRKAHLIDYVGRVCARAAAHLAGFNGPLVVVAGEEIQGLVRQNGALRRVVPPGVVANPDALSAEELHRRAFDLVRPSFEETRRAAVERFNALHGDAGSAERTAVRTDEVMVAARDGRVGVLLVAENDRVWGRYREDYHRAFPHHHPTDGSVDLVERAATETLRRGGVVHVVAKSDLPSGASTAAVLRF